MNHQYKAKVRRVVDGDTLDLDIDLGFRITLRERVRLMGIDTPETRTRGPVEKANGLKSKSFVEDFIALKDGNVVLKVHGFGKFGRPLVDLYKGDICLNERLVHFGLAAPYFGGKR